MAPLVPPDDVEAVVAVVVGAVVSVAGGGDGDVVGEAPGGGGRVGGGERGGGEGEGGEDRRRQDGRTGKRGKEGLGARRRDSLLPARASLAGVLIDASQGTMGMRRLENEEEGQNHAGSLVSRSKGRKGAS